MGCVCLHKNLFVLSWDVSRDAEVESQNCLSGKVTKPEFQHLCVCLSVKSRSHWILERDLDASRFYSIDCLTSLHNCSVLDGKKFPKKGYRNRHRHDRLRPVITRKLTWSSILQEQADQGWISSVRKLLSASWEASILWRGAFLMGTLCWVRPFLWMNWIMHIFNEVSSPQHWSSYLLRQTPSLLGTVLPGFHVLAITQALAERTKNRAVNPGVIIDHAQWKQKSGGCHLFDAILNKPWIVHSRRWFELGNLKVLNPKGSKQRYKTKRRKQILAAATCERCPLVVPLFFFFLFFFFKMPTAHDMPRWSPIQVLPRPDPA